MEDQIQAILSTMHIPTASELETKLDRLEVTKQSLIEEKCNLQNQIEDLRALIARVVKEGEMNRKRHAQVRVELEGEIKRVEAALDVIRKKGGEFDQTVELWGDLEL